MRWVQGSIILNRTKEYMVGPGCDVSNRRKQCEGFSAGRRYTVWNDMRKE